jgi:hypothetical protein
MLKKIQITILMLAFAISLFLDNVYFLIPLALIAVIIGIWEYKKSKEELKSADKYCRIEIRIADQNNFFKSKWFQFILFIIIGIGIYLLVVYPSSIDFSPAAQGLIYLIMISFHFGNMYHIFTGSIRSFEEGIKLPGRNANVIPWHKVNAIQMENLTVSITHEGGSDAWLLKSADEEDMQLMIADWERLGQNYFKQ